MIENCHNHKSVSELKLVSSADNFANSLDQDQA